MDALIKQATQTLQDMYLISDREARLTLSHQAGEQWGQIANRMQSHPDFDNHNVIQALFNRVEASLWGWNLHMALETMEQIAKLDHRSANDYACLGKIHFQMGNFSDAVVAFERSFKGGYDRQNHPKHDQALNHSYLARSYLLVGKPENALQQIRKAEALELNQDALGDLYGVEADIIAHQEGNLAAIQFLERINTEKKVNIAQSPTLLQKIGLLIAGDNHHEHDYLSMALGIVVDTDPDKRNQYSTIAGIKSERLLPRDMKKGLEQSCKEGHPYFLDDELDFYVNFL
tara:strand:- start:1160 stop:2023 length:864 start_codon:yes stop_codon:yes gene_type:complete